MGNKILLIILVTLFGFSLGIIYGSFTLPEGSGLAGPAIVLGKGLAGAILFLILSIFLSKKLNKDKIKKINTVLLLLLIIQLGWIIYSISINPSKEEPHNPHLKPTEPVSLNTIAGSQFPGC